MQTKFVLIASAFGIWAVITWNGGWIASWNLPFWNSASNLPLGTAKGIVVDDEGRIYIGSQFYNRIQLYDVSGAYLNGWFIQGNSGPFRMRINAQDQIEVASRRTDKIFTFDDEGNLIKRVEALNPYDEFGNKNERIHIDERGDLYEIRNGAILPAVTRNNIIVVRTPWYLWLTMAPFPAWLFGILAALTTLALKETSSKQIGSR
jgi:hypothetical protein